MECRYNGRGHLNHQPSNDSVRSRDLVNVSSSQFGEEIAHVAGYSQIADGMRFLNYRKECDLARLSKENIANLAGSL